METWIAVLVGMIIGFVAAMYWKSDNSLRKPSKERVITVEPEK